MHLFAHFEFDFHLMDKCSLRDLFASRAGLLGDFCAEAVEICYLSPRRVLFFQKSNNLLGIRQTDQDKRLQIKDTRLGILSASTCPKLRYCAVEGLTADWSSSARTPESSTFTPSRA